MSPSSPSRRIGQPGDGQGRTVGVVRVVLGGGARGRMGVLQGHQIARHQGVQGGLILADQLALAVAHGQLQSATGPW